MTEAVIDREAWRVDSEERAVWVVDKINTYNERLARLDAQYQAMREALIDEKVEFETRFLLELEDWAKANPPKKGRSIKLLTGTIGFRRVNGGPRIRDKEAFIAYAKEAAPDLIITETVHKPDTDRVKQHVTETGELFPGVEIVETEDRFYVKGNPND